MIPYVGGRPAQEIERRCDRDARVLISILPDLTGLPAGPPPPRITDGNGLTAHLVVHIGGSSRTNDERLTFGTDPGTYRLRAGWSIRPAGGGGVFQVKHIYWPGDWDYQQQRFALSVVPPADGVIVPPLFGEQTPAPYTHIRVLRGAVQDETGNVLPLNVDVRLGSFWAPARSMYELVLEA